MGVLSFPREVRGEAFGQMEVHAHALEVEADHGACFSLVKVDLGFYLTFCPLIISDFPRPEIVGKFGIAGLCLWRKAMCRLGFWMIRRLRLRRMEEREREKGERVDDGGQ